MTPNELTILKSLVAVAWADGDVAAPEQGILDGLLWAFGASEEEEAALREFAKEKRTFKADVPVDALTDADKELLLAHAALLTHADGAQTKTEQKVLTSLVKLLGFDEVTSKRIIAEAKSRAKSG